MKGYFPVLQKQKQDFHELYVHIGNERPKPKSYIITMKIKKYVKLNNNHENNNQYGKGMLLLVLIRRLAGYLLIGLNASAS